MHIAIAGNIGAGKTTLARRLAAHYQWDAFFESVEDNPYLENFYGDMPRWAFHLQIYFLNNRFNQVMRVQQNPNPTIQDRTIYEDAHVFAANLRQTGLMSTRDYATYLEVFQSFSGFVTPPDLLIYLQADLHKLKSQIQQRGRDFESVIEDQYLIDLNQHYEDWISTYQEGALLVVNINDIDLLHNSQDWQNLLNQIDRSVSITS